MFKPITMMLLCLSTQAMAWTWDDVHRIENKLAAANSIVALPVLIEKNTYRYCGKAYTACTNGKVIVITYDTLNNLKNEDELAGLIGHEMAHALTEDEMQADLLGLNYAAKAGYNYCKAAQRLRGRPKDPEHPSGDVRYANTRCPL